MTWLPSVSTFFSVIVSNVGFRFACASLSGIQRVRRAEDLLEVRLVDLVRDDGRAFRDEGPQPARVIDVVVRVDDVPDRLARDQPFRFGDDLRWRALRSAVLR